MPGGLYTTELDILSARLNRLGDTGADESIIKSVEEAMKAKAARYEKLEEELKLLRSRAFSMATPRVDSWRRRADSFASATSAQTAMSEDEDEDYNRGRKKHCNVFKGLSLKWFSG